MGLQVAPALALCLMLGLVKQAVAVDKIVGGNPAPQGRYPWQVLVLPSNFMCGGVLIRDRVVLTAAHCVENILSSDTKVELGRYFLNSGEFERLSVASTVIHESWISNTFENDIALLLLKTNTTIPTIKLAKASEVPLAGVKLRVIGWGTTFFGGQVSEELRQVSVPVISTKKCNSPSSYAGSISASMFCAGPLVGGKDSCQGDSGGPIFRVGADSTGKDDVHMGIVSWGNGCATPDFPGVYTSTAYMRKWINSKLKLWGY